MMVRRVLLALLLSLVLALPAGAEAKWPLWSVLDAASVQLYVKEFGGLAAICSAGQIVAPPGVVTAAVYPGVEFYLTAGHCTLDNSVRYAITRDGLNFVEVKVLATGISRIGGEVRPREVAQEPSDRATRSAAGQQGGLRRGRLDAASRAAEGRRVRHTRRSADEDRHVR